MPAGSELCWLWRPTREGRWGRESNGNSIKGEGVHSDGKRREDNVVGKGYAVMEGASRGSSSSATSSCLRDTPARRRRQYVMVVSIKILEGVAGREGNSLCMASSDWYHLFVMSRVRPSTVRGRVGEGKQCQSPHHYLYRPAHSRGINNGKYGE